MDYIAHVRKNRQTDDKEFQSLFTHLSESGELAERFAEKIGLPNAGKLLGLIHDLGKYSQAFQDYIREVTYWHDQDRDDTEDDDVSKKGKVDHSSAGAQYIYRRLTTLSKKPGKFRIVGEILALCVASHHSGLIDCFDFKPSDNFMNRMDKVDELTHFNEAITKAEPELIESLEALCNKQLVNDVFNIIAKFGGRSKNPASYATIEAQFFIGLLTRFLFSCLIDADRINSAEYDSPERQTIRLQKPEQPDWQRAIVAVESKLATLDSSGLVNQIRHEISVICKQRASDEQGIYTLTVPTGGGKTYASLRYALHHAAKHNLDRIVFVIPFTSIIEQNANAIRECFDADPTLKEWVLEHHSNLDPKDQSWKSKLVSENWDSPIVLTTSVQVLEALFAGGTKSVRRFHPLAKSVLIFDEIQALPIKCVRMFCHSMNFLAEYCNSTVLLCSATQPTLNRLSSPEKGVIRFKHNAEHAEIVPKFESYYRKLKRVELHNLCKEGGWTKPDIVNFVLQQYQEKQSCLVIVNTKAWAKAIYENCAEDVPEDAIFHLSTNMCPAQRKDKFEEMHNRIEDNLPVLCVSTQLIEAGVDISFESVVRFLAGLDSIAQAAGRCNRHGELDELGKVYVINPAEEPLQKLLDIKTGKEKTQNVLAMDYDDYLSPEALSRYFYAYFLNRESDLDYPDDVKGQHVTLLNILSQHKGSELATDSNNAFPRMKQAFMTAGKLFKVIDAPTQAVIVPYGEGESLINELLHVDTDYSLGEFNKLLQQAQQYSVNLFPHVWDELMRAKALHEIQGLGIYYLKKTHYDDAYGVKVSSDGSTELSVF